MSVMHKNVQKREGFTLIEILLYITITSMMVLAFSRFVPVILDTRAKSHTIREVDEQGTSIMENIANTTLQALSIDTPVRSTVSSTLILEMASSTINPTVFNLQEGTIYITEGSNDPVALSNTYVNISDLMFTNMSVGENDDSIKIEYSLQVEVPEQKGTLYQYEQLYRGSASIRK